MDIFVVVNFDALAQASDIQIERRQVVFLCWMQDLNPGGAVHYGYIHIYKICMYSYVWMETYLINVWVCAHACMCVWVVWCGAVWWGGVWCDGVSICVMIFLSWAFTYSVCIEYIIEQRGGINHEIINVQSLPVKFYIVVEEHDKQLLNYHHYVNLVFCQTIDMQKIGLVIEHWRL